MTDILPVFQEYSFLFRDGIPPHIEDYPDTPNYPDLFSVFGTIDGNRPYPLAVDVEHLALAVLIAKAREDRQEESISEYGYTDDVYIAHPDGHEQRMYFGRTR